jgi:hypothetical protein
MSERVAKADCPAGFVDQSSLTMRQDYASTPKRRPAQRPDNPPCLSNVRHVVRSLRSFWFWPSMLVRAACHCSVDQLRSS